MAKFAVRSVRVVFNVEEFADDKLVKIQEVPVQVFEVQFDTQIQSLVDQLLAQANSSSEASDDGEDSKE